MFSGNVLFGGSAGGHGGGGGIGGAGGGGAGGPSLGIVYASGAVANIGSTTAIQTGSGGKGAGGAPDGSRALTLAP